MDGFKRPTRRPSRPLTPHTHPAQPRTLPPVASEGASDGAPRPLDMSLPEAGKSIKPKASLMSKRLVAIWVGLAVILMILIVGGYVWFSTQLDPVNADNHMVQRVEVKEGTAFTYIASRLKERGLIRSTVAFDVYARVTGKRSAVQAGTCSLTASESAREILNKLTSGCHDFKSITFYPGATIEKPLYKPAHAELDDTMNIKSVLERAGYSSSEIQAALAKSYNSPLFADKPDGASLEGYIYGETYYVDTDATAEHVLEKTFAQMYKEVGPLIPAYKQQGLNLYQAITLASIIQRELNCEGKPEERRARCQGYQETIAQIFLKRLRENMTLGSDVTFIYAADMMKVAPSVKIDSPYNTRIHPGLPPGPIASPGASALQALAHPSDTDYLFFIAGDDGLIYFAKTDAEHQKNIKEHCQKLCNEL